MVQAGTRKRPAPGSSPLHFSGSNNNEMSTNAQNTAYGWQNSGGDSGFGNDPGYDSYSNIPTSPQTQLQYGARAANQIARRPVNQNLVQTQKLPTIGNGTWDGHQGALGDDWQTSYDDLDQRAEIAKREVQAKRKHIPPFIQKLSRFLDESRNTELIRWSNDGDSFIVLDEDEFAKTLIPELFKHNNYASFVRQLNMYGFHKKVGLSDNSMRASERKNKQPSEYSNPFFKRGRPNLLWLIHKPKTAQTKTTGKGRHRQEDLDEDVDEIFGRENSPIPAIADPLDENQSFSGRQQPLLTMGGTTNRLPQDELASLRRELRAVQENQKMIREMLKQTRAEHQQLYGEAKAFHDLHEKHDNSINAILTFLATVYNKNLAAGQAGTGDMFPGKIQANEQARGSVVDMGDEGGQTPGPFKRPQLLLEGRTQSASTPTDHTGYRRATRLSAEQHLSPSQALHSPTVQELSDYTPSNRSSESPPRQTVDGNSNTNSGDNRRAIPEADILRMMNNASNAQSTALASRNSNATTPILDFPEALSHLQNADGASPLTTQQRQNMLQMMANEHSAASNPGTPNNAQALTYGTSTPSAQNLANFDLSNDQLNQIQQSLREQDERMANIHNTIAPLSPSGSIPGVNDGSTQSYAQNPDVWDIDSIFNSGDYFSDGAGLADLPDFDFGTGNDPSGNGEGIDDMNEGAGVGAGTTTGEVETVDGSGATSPAKTTTRPAGGGGDDSSNANEVRSEPPTTRRVTRAGGGA